MKYLLALMLFFTAIHVACAKTYILNDSNPSGIALFNYLESYIDSQQTSNLNDIVGVKTHDPKLDFKNSIFADFKNYYWYKLSIRNNSSLHHAILLVRNPSIDYIDFYYYNLENNIVKVHTGDRLPFSSRPIKCDPNFAFNVDLKDGLNTFYFCFKTSNLIRPPLFLYSVDNYQTSVFSNALITGACLGFISLMCAFFFLSTLYFKRKLVFILLLLMICALFYMAQDYGIIFKYFLRNHPIIDDYLAMLLINIGCIIALWSGSNFFKQDPNKSNYLKKFFVKYYVVFVNSLCCLIIILMFFVDFNTIRYLTYGIFSISYSIGYLIYFINYGLKKNYIFITIGYFIFFISILGETRIQQFTIQLNTNFYLINYIPDLLIIVGLITWGYGIISVTKIRLDQDDFLYEAIKKSEKVEEEFVTAICHELGSPMQSAQFAIEKINRIEVSQQVKKQIDYLNISLTKISFLIKNFIKKAQSKNYQITLDLKEENIVDLIKTTITILDLFINEKKHELIFKIDDINLKYFAVIDKGSIEQVLTNVLLNSIKYTPMNGKILIILKKDNENIIISIVDNGIGIEQNENMDNIFRAFYRSDYLKDKGGGIGIGLSICKKIINDHNGSITYKSPLDKKYKEIMQLSHNRIGTIFTISLPILQKIPLRFQDEINQSL